MKVSKYKISENLWRCECGKEFTKSQSLNAHLSHCDYHHKCLGTMRKLRPHEIDHCMAGWENKSEEEINDYHKKSGITYHQNVISGKYIPVFLGKHHTEDSKQKTRESTIKYIKGLSNYKGNVARFSDKACKYIDNLNKEKNWNLQHAKNGGEIQINGYFLDGYDKDLNIVFEYDEPRHYKDLINNVLNERDIQRQNNIINKLNCQFWRYNEYLDLLYKVN